MFHENGLKSLGEKKQKKKKIAFLSPGTKKKVQKSI